MGKFKRKNQQPPLCACGCGKKVKRHYQINKWNKYISGHNRRGTKNTKEHRKKIGLGNKGKKVSEKSKRKISNAHKGKIFSKETKKKISDANKGKILSKKHIEKIRQGNKGKKIPVETREKMSIAKQNMTEETKRKMSITRKGKFIGEESSQWKGGISCEPYCEIWIDKKYKQSIRDRDNNKCQNPDCWKTTKRIAIHHINYIKKDCHPRNLITICASCNSRANKNRENHAMFYQNIMTKKYGYIYNEK